MVIVFLMSNSSIGVGVCDHVLVFQCLCVHRSEAQQQQRGESQKSPVINVIDARCVCVCLCACLLPSQHSAGVPSLLSETHHSLPRQQWTSPRLCLCECAYVHVGGCVSANYDSSCWVQSGYPHTPVWGTPTHICYLPCLYLYPLIATSSSLHQLSYLPCLPDSLILIALWFLISTLGCIIYLLLWSEQERKISQRKQL